MPSTWATKRTGTSGFGTEEGAATLIVCIVFQILAIIAVGMRVVAASMIKRAYKAHDYLAFAALIVSLGYFVICVLAVTQGGFGLHITEVSLEGLVVLLKVFYASFYVWITATMLVKLSILQLYISLFVTPWFRKTAWVLSGITVAFWAAYIVVAIAICQPIKKNWEPTTPGYCGSVVGQEIASATVNMLLDLAIAVSPLPVLWGIKTSLEKRIYLIGIVLTGLVICAMNAARIGLEATTSGSLDITYTNAYIALFAGLETWIGIIVSCIPLWGPIIFPSRNTQTKGRSGQGSRYGVLKFWNKRAIGSSGTYDSMPLESNVSRNQARKWKAAKLGSIDGPGSQVDHLVSKGDAEAQWASAESRPTEAGNLARDGINVETEIRITSSAV